MKRVLIVTYWYPPNQTIASLRLGKFAKYLPDFGWEPVIVTVKPGSDLYLRTGSLPEEIRGAGRVYRTKDYSLGVWAYILLNAIGKRPQAAFPTTQSYSFYGSRNILARAAYWIYRQWLCFPDECWPWLLEYPAVRKIVAQERPNVILSSSLPATAHLIANRLASEFRNPWVADFRDPWSHSYTLRRIYPLNRLETALEKKTLRPACALMTVSEPIRDHLARLHQKPAYVILNGFDEEEEARAETRGSDEPASEGPVFSMVYTGNIYAGKQNPSSLLNALTALMRRGLLSPQDIRVKFYGRNLNVVSQALQSFPDLKDSVALLGEVSHEQSLREQRVATALLFLEWEDLNDRGVLTGKIFEYLAAGRPILVCGPRGGAIDPLLKATGAGVVVTTSEEAQAVLANWISEFRQTGQLKSSVLPELLKPYSRRYQTGKVAEVLESVTHPL
jgi:glycosyltransferase involved in cell wall biosynthesis